MTADSETPAVDRRDRIGVRDNARSSRYEAVLEGETVGLLLYERTSSAIELVHTVTDPEHRGEGAASMLTLTALAEARAQGLRVVVICPFVESWLQRHPEHAAGVVRG